PAVAWFSDMDLPLLWSALNKEIGQSGIPDAEQSFRMLRAQFAAMTGVELDRALDSFGGECGLVFTLDETRTINVPVAGSVVQIPELGFMLVCKVKNDTIFDLIDSTLNTNLSVIRTDRSGFKMRTLPSPTPVPLN